MVTRGALKRKEGSLVVGKQAPASLVSSGEVVTLPIKSIEDIKMADAKEMIRRMGQMLRENMDRHLETMKAREEEESKKHKEIKEERQRGLREDREVLINQMERLRIEKAQDRGKELQSLPQYDGSNHDIDEWQEKIEAVTKWNRWNPSKLIEVIPVSLSGQAKRAFDSLTEDDKQSVGAFFLSMRRKLDPQAKLRNKELFMLAKRHKNESVSRFVDRLKMYVRRWGKDPTDVFATEIMKYKCFECLSFADQKVLRTAMDQNENLDKIVKIADSLASAETCTIGMVDYSQNEREVSGQ